MLLEKFCQILRAEGIEYRRGHYAPGGIRYPAFERGGIAIRETLSCEDMICRALFKALYF